MTRRGMAIGLAWATIAWVAPAVAQDVTPPGYSVPPLPSVTTATPAKELFGRAKRPSAGPEASIGFYSKGCLAGASALPLSGPTWQVMRPSRNRYYGRSALIAFVKRFSSRVATNTAWPGVLIGDMSQPRGGPMLKGHASHQIGLDVDVWLRPMPKVDMTLIQRETIMSTNVVAETRSDMNAYWSSDTLQVIKTAASDPAVERVLVNPAIKKQVCMQAKGDRSWLRKVRPVWGHDYHFHVRLGCQAGDALCKSQNEPGAAEGCGKDLDWWFTPGRLFPRPPKVPPKPAPPLTLAGLPPACTAVLNGR
ncbi:penicillin-insensitive murein endopeptidase [Hansschlegelia sp. KR7-227]|jgi:penicillin-insensitive murein endopeptidase|uniref:penicillin-insensitive murein endopeptidase n=1 Tax=Hansschlegelia sp. KR7-227 TaxID=3400914 RepID=UPI003BFED3F1